MCVCLSVCMSLASDTSESIEVIIIKLDMLMHYVLIILTLAFIQGHTDLNRENNKCLIVLKTDQAICITFAAQIVLLKDRD